MLGHVHRLALVGLLAALPAAGWSQTTDSTLPPATPPAATPETAEAPPAPAAPIDGQILMQSEDTVLARDLLGSRVYDNLDATIGDINNLIVNTDGTIDGVVIGVGGFLGMGEKEVAVEMASLTLQPASPGRVRLILATSREELEAAPAFLSLYQQQLATEGAGAPAPAPMQPAPSN